MRGRGAHTRVGVIEEHSATLEGFIARRARTYTVLDSCLCLQLPHNILQMYSNKVNKTISLTNILIFTSTARALESILCVQRLRVLKLQMNIKHALLRKPLLTMLALMGQYIIVTCQMIMHCGLILSSKLAVVADEMSVGILNVLECHSN
jgi:hypothetical protein